MNPEQPSPYDFIMNDKRKTTPIFNLGGRNLKQRILQAAVVAGLLLVVFVLIFSFVLKGGGSDTNNLLQVAAAQQDLIDLTSLGKQNLQDQQLINQNQSVKIIVTSQYKDLAAFLSSHGVSKVAQKIVPLQNTQYKTTLSNAKDNGQYDTAFRSVLTDKIGVYQSKLKIAYAAAKSNTLKTMLANEYSQIGTLASSD